MPDWRDFTNTSGLPRLTARKGTSYGYLVYGPTGLTLPHAGILLLVFFLLVRLIVPPIQSRDRHRGLPCLS